MASTIATPRRLVMLGLLLVGTTGITGCGDDEPVATGDDTTTTTAKSGSKKSTTTTTADPAASEIGTPFEVNLFGTTVTVESAAVFTDGNAGKYIEAELTVDNSSSSFEFNPDVALVCATNFYPGRYLEGVAPQSGGTPFPIDTEVPAGAVVQGTVLLTKPVNDRTGEVLPDCSTRAAITVLEAQPQVTIQLGPDLTAELYPEAG